jgi:hypothetical protein
LFERFAPITLPPGDYDIGEIFYDSVPLAHVGSPACQSRSSTAEFGQSRGIYGPRTAYLIALYGPTLEMGVWAPSVPEPAT